MKANRLQEAINLMRNTELKVMGRVFVLVLSCVWVFLTLLQVTGTLLREFMTELLIHNRTLCACVCCILSTLMCDKGSTTH